MTKSLSVFFVCLILASPVAAALPVTFSGESPIDGQDLDVGIKDRKGLVVLFLSAVCPCSNSHLPEIKNLAEKHPDFQFLAVHSNSDEGDDLASEYFRTAKLPFPVLRDPGSKLADEFKALKTPHAFLVLPNGSLAFQGGVSSSSKFDESVERKYLREALQDLSEGRSVRTPKARPLGCEISRGGKDAN